MANIFSLTYSAVINTLKGSDVTDFDTTIGAGDGSTMVQAELDRVCGHIISRLPKRYRDMLSAVEGEILTEDATDGDVEFTLSLSEASSVKLYKNYFYPARRDGVEEDYTLDYQRNYPKRWSDRNVDDEMESTDYSVSGQTVTLDNALADHDTLYAVYAHNLSSPPDMLVQIILDVARHECATKYLFGFSDAVPESVSKGYDNALSMMRDIRKGDLGIKDFDDIDLVDDWERSQGFVQLGIIRKG